MNLGYARVSDKDQNPGRQIEKFKALGIEERFIFIDKQTGKTFERQEYQAMKRMLREGDILYLDALNRLGRDYDGIINEWKEITRTLGADIVVLDHEHVFDSRKFRAMGKIGRLMEDQFLSILSYFADQAREDIRRTQREGIDLALAEGRKYGRPKIPITPAFINAYKRWKAKEITAVKAMELVHMKPNTFYRRVKLYEQSIKKQESD